MGGEGNFQRGECRVLRHHDGEDTKVWWGVWIRSEGDLGQVKGMGIVSYKGGRDSCTGITVGLGSCGLSGSWVNTRKVERE